MPKLNDDEWRLVLELSEAIADLTLEQQLLHLESACSSRETIREVLNVIQGFQAKPDLPSRVGTRVGRFTITEYLGSGGVGDVYAATDEELGRTVALKFLTPAAGEQTGAVERLIREARTASALNHSNIVTVHEIIREGSTIAIVMEYVGGKSLRLECGTPLAFERVISIGCQIALALAAAHNSGIVHRDIKPENVIVRQDGGLKVLDFGLATWVEEQQTGVSTSHQFAGTWRYMSPEQTTGETITSATDIYSLGLVLYELTTGTLPVSWRSIEIQVAGLGRKVIPPSKRRSGIPTGFVSLILSMLSREAANRPRADEIAKELARFNYGRSIPPHTVRRSYTLPLLASLAAITFGVFLLIFSRETAESRPLLTPFPIAVEAGYKSRPSFSPDANWVAYQWDRPEVGLRIYLRRISAENEAPSEPVRLTNSNQVEKFPAWSPDGKSVAFIRYKEPYRGALIVDDLFTHRERELAEIYGLGLSWMPNGKWLLACDFHNAQGTIVLISPTTRVKRILVTSGLNESYENASVSPDGRKLVFVTRDFRQRAQLAELKLDSEYNSVGKAASLDWKSFRSALIASPIWTANSRDLLFVGAPDGISRAWRSNDGSAPNLVSDLGENVFDFGFSPSHQRLAYSRTVDDTNIWRLDLKDVRSGKSVSDAATQIVASSRMDQRPSVSPDGRMLAYESNGGGFTEIWLADSRGGQTRPLTQMRAPSGSPRWSHDGRWIVFDSHGTGGSRLFKISSAGGRPMQLTAGYVGAVMPVWSADDRFIYFASSRSGASRIWKVSAEGGEVIRVSSKPGTAPEITPDGRFLFYLADSDTPSTLWRMDLRNNKSVAIANRVAFRNVSAGQRLVYYLTGDDLILRAQDLNTGRIAKLCKLARNTVGGMSISASGQYLYFAEFDHFGNELMAVNNLQ